MNNEFIVPANVRDSMLDSSISQKARVGRTINWFLRNRVPHTLEFSLIEFARELSKPLKPYGTKVSQQVAWTWSAERNLPLTDKFSTIVAHVEGLARNATAEDGFAWQYELAKIMLEILGDTAMPEYKEDAK